MAVRLTEPSGLRKQNAPAWFVDPQVQQTAPRLETLGRLVHARERLRGLQLKLGYPDRHQGAQVLQGPAEAVAQG